MGSRRENQWHDRIMIEKMAGKMMAGLMVELVDESIKACVLSWIQKVMS